MQNKPSRDTGSRTSPPRNDETAQRGTSLVRTGRVPGAPGAMQVIGDGGKLGAGEKTAEISNFAEGNGAAALALWKRNPAPQQHRGPRSTAKQKT